MKQLISVFVLLGLLWVGVGETYAQSVEGGIDWDASTMDLERYVDGVQAEISCQGLYGNQIQLTLADLKTADPISDGSGNIEFTGAISDCFTLIGNYQISVNIVDLSGNTTTQQFSTIIVPAEISENESDIVVECDQDLVAPNTQYPKANNTDTCTVTIDLKDRFGNIIDPSQATFQFQDLATNKPDANYETQFYEGLTIENIQQNGTTLTFDVKAAAPSLHQYGSDLSCLDDRILDLMIEAPAINANGQPLPTTMTLSKRVNLRFDPMYSVDIDRPEILILPGPIPMDLDYTTHGGTEAIDPNSSIYTTIHETVNNFENVDTNKTTLGIDTYGHPFADGTTSVSTEVPNLPTQNDPLHFIVKTNYTLGGNPISYPAGYVGPDPTAVPTLNVANDESCVRLVGQIDPFPVMLVGAFIESDILSTGADVHTFGDFGNLNFSVLNTLSRGMGALEVRSDMRQSIWSQLQKTPYPCPVSGIVEVESTTEFESLWGNNDTVLFQNCEVRIGKEGGLGLPKIHIPEGRKTLLVQNGNIKINANMVYDRVEDSLGVVSINDEVDAYPSVGNIMIHPKVREFAGTYYADGGFFGYDGSDDLINQSGSLNTSIIRNSPVKDNLNNRQLILTGNIVSNNTLGGYMIKSNQLYDDPKFFSGWEAESDNVRGLQYDLHYVRRFDDLGDDNLCSRQQNGGDCDENPMAFVIRNDRRAINFPPPGFQNVSTYNTIGQ